LPFERILSGRGLRVVDVNQRFTISRESFGRFVAAIWVFQSVRQSATAQGQRMTAPFSLDLLESVRGIDSGDLPLQAALARITDLAMGIVGGDGAALWLFTPEKRLFQATAATFPEDRQLRTALSSKLQSAGAFGDDPPAKVDLTSTLERYAGLHGSTLAIAILPGHQIAGALAVVSLQSEYFTSASYANLRVLAELAQYAVTKKMASPELRTLLDHSPNENSATGLVTEIGDTSSTERSATAPLAYLHPSPADVRDSQIAIPDASEVRPRIAVDENGGERPQMRPIVQSGSRAIRMARAGTPLLSTLALDAVNDSLMYVREMRVNWRAVKESVPAFAILAIMSFFAGLQTSSRTPFIVSSVNATNEAFTNNSLNQPPPLTRGIGPNQANPIPTQTSHLRITDRDTSTAIAELSKFEVRNLPRAAEYGDDEAAFQLGMLYELGRGFRQDCKKAAEWVTKSAEAGNVAAQYNLGLRYRDGDGVTADAQQARGWLNRAALRKSASARVALSELSSQ
jgi:Sel1 repeat-containing protein